MYCYLILRITCCVKNCNTLLKLKCVDMYFFILITWYHRDLCKSDLKKAYWLSTLTKKVSNLPQNWILIVSTSQMCGRNGRKCGNCIGYWVAFQKGRCHTHSNYPKYSLTLEKAIKLCRITEESKEQSKIFISPTTQMGSIHAVKKTKPQVDTGKSKNKDLQRIMKCKFFTTCHDKGNCLAYRAMCHKCNGRNHYAQCCFKSKNSTEEASSSHESRGAYWRVWTSRKFKVVLEGTFSQIYLLMTFLQVLNLILVQNVM